MSCDHKTPPVGGSALPYGVMMRAGSQVAVAVRRPADGQVVCETFTASAGRLASSRLGRLPLVRAALAVRQAGETGRQALAVMGRLSGLTDAARRLGPAGRALALCVVIGAAALQLALFRVVPLVAAKEAGLTGAAFLAVEAVLRLALMVGALRLIALAPRARRLLAYHGAEHMAIACLEQGRPLSVSQAAGCSRFHRRCGTSFLVGSALVSLVVYAPLLALPGGFSYPVLIATRMLLAPLVSAIALEAQRIVTRGEGRIARLLSAPGLAAQRLTTAQPTPAELEVAIAALKGAIGSREAPQAQAA